MLTQVLEVSHLSFVLIVPLCSLFSPFSKILLSVSSFWNHKILASALKWCPLFNSSASSHPIPLLYDCHGATVIHIHNRYPTFLFLWHRDGVKSKVWTFPLYGEGTVSRVLPISTFSLHLIFFNIIFFFF